MLFLVDVSHDTGFVLDCPPGHGLRAVIALFPAFHILSEHHVFLPQLHLPLVVHVVRVGERLIGEVLKVLADTNNMK